MALASVDEMLKVNVSQRRGNAVRLELAERGDMAAMAPLDGGRNVRHGGYPIVLELTPSLRLFSLTVMPKSHV